jgi:DNA-directed RNA polymerase subunit beta'
MGVDTHKDGNRIQLAPLTDKQTLAISNGELKRPALAIRGKDARPEKGSIFDPEITGTRWPQGKFGDKWSHINLAVRMPNPVFEKPIRELIGLTKPELENVIAGKKSIDGKTGPEALTHALTQIDVGKKLEELKKQLPTARGAKLNKTTSQIRYLNALSSLGLKPHEAYTVQHLPVIPPNMRPISVMDNGDLSTDDLNDLYRFIGATNEKLKGFNYSIMPEEESHDLKQELYDGLKSLTLTGKTFHGRHRKGIGEIVGGGGGRKAKEAFFQGKVIGKRQDLSMRGVIVPEPALNLDEVAIPRKAAAEIYKPFVVRRLVQQGLKPSEALIKVRKNAPEAHAALDAEVRDRPLWLKRDPVLHKYGVQAFLPKLTTGQAIKIHPLATSGFNADFDGDKMGAFVPVSHDAVMEAFNSLPSRNLFSPSHGKLMYAPSQESMLGLYKLSKFGKATEHRFKTAAEAAKAAHEGKIGITDVIHVDDPHVVINHDPTHPDMTLAKIAAGPVKTTVGRLLLYQRLPEKFRDPKIISDPEFELNKAKLGSLLEDVGKNDPKRFPETADKLKDLGNQASTGESFGLHDLLADTHHRDEILSKALKEEKKIRAATPEKHKRDEKLVKLYETANDEIQKITKARADASKNRMYNWVRSGARGNWDQYRQMTVAPMLVVDSKGKTIPTPITKSYSEGLDMGSYFAAMHGARMGAIGRQISTADPGALTKEMMQSSMDQLITNHDCGTNRGIAMNVENDSKNMLDRFLARDVPLGVRGGKDKGVIPAGTAVTPELVARLKNNKIKDVTVRTPLKCAEPHGICSVCYGVGHTGAMHQKGTNLGVIAAHSLGEPLTQMAMNAFHTGGVAGSIGARAVDQFTIVQQLVHMPETLPGSAVLSTADGEVEKVLHDKATGGWKVHIGGVEHFVPALKGAPIVKAGQKLEKGDSLSHGPKNPRDLLPLKGLKAVQQYLVDELEGIYGGKSNIHRRNAEVFVRALTNLSEVVDPGDHPELMRGDKVTTSQVAHFNSNLSKDKKPVQYHPVLKGTTVLPTEMQTDWLAMLQSKNLKRTIGEGAAEGWFSDIHHVHPIPGMAIGMEFGKGKPKQPWLY